MKKVVSETISDKEDMKPEYDFSNMQGGVRGKYYKAYRAGHKLLFIKRMALPRSNILSLKTEQLC